MLQEIRPPRAAGPGGLERAGKGRAWDLKDTSASPEPASAWHQNQGRTKTPTTQQVSPSLPGLGPHLDTDGQEVDRDGNTLPKEPAPGHCDPCPAPGVLLVSAATHCWSPVMSRAGAEAWEGAWLWAPRATGVSEPLDSVTCTNTGAVSRSIATEGIFI